MKDQIKKFAKSEGLRIAYFSAGAIVGVAAYTIACKAVGYNMMVPQSMNDEGIHLRSITGKHLISRCLNP